MHFKYAEFCKEKNDFLKCQVPSFCHCYSQPVYDATYVKGKCYGHFQTKKEKERKDVPSWAKKDI